MDLEYLLNVNWPNPSVNKNDSEIQMFSKYFDVIDKSEMIKQMTDISTDEEIKSIDKSNIFRTEGNKCYKDLNYVEALKKYNISISLAPRDSIEFGLAVANRSAVLLDMEKYPECLVDITTVLRSEYPEDLKHKIYMRQSKCYLKLKENFEAAKSIRRAQECANKLINLNHFTSVNDKIIEIENLLKEQLESKVPNIELDEDMFSEPSLKDGENTKFLSAAKVVDFKYTKKLGRHVVANTDIKKGDVLFIEKPYAFVILDNDETLFNVCAFCLRRSLNSIPCTICTSFFYCTEKCRQNAWNSNHRWLCLGARRDIINDHYLKLSLATLFKASLDDFRTNVEDESVYGNKENNYPFVNKLLTQKNKTHEFGFEMCIKSAVWMVLYLKNFTDYFDWLYTYPNRPEGSQEELYNFIGGQLVKYSLQNATNPVILREGNVYYHLNKLSLFRTSAIAMGNFVSTGLLNHSCLPNVVHSFHETTRVVTAIKDVKQGTEITINYLNTSYYVSNAEQRQADLKRYMFRCSCQACIDRMFDELRRPWLCVECLGKAFTVKDDGVIAKCSECHVLFNIAEYIDNEMVIDELFTSYNISGDQNQLETIHKIMNKIYHKHNVKYYSYYNISIQHYQKKDMKKLLDVVKSGVELAENLYGDISERYICKLLTYTGELTKYCIILRQQNSDNYKQFFEEANAMIKKLANILQYYMSTENVKNFVMNITKYVNSNDIDMKIGDCDLEGSEELYTDNLV